MGYILSPLLGRQNLNWPLVSFFVFEITIVRPNGNNLVYPHSEGLK
jgi:hypothetical protein